MPRGLSNREQAILMCFVFVLPSVVTWAGLGMPTDRNSLGLLISSMLSGVLVFLKEILGGQPPPEESAPNPGEEHKNPDIVARVGNLEVSMGEVKTDIKWIKILVAPTFLVSLVSLLILIASNLK